MPTLSDNNGKEYGILIGKVDAMHTDIIEIKQKLDNMTECYSNHEARIAVNTERILTHITGHDERIMKFGGLLGAIVGGIVLILGKIGV